MTNREIIELMEGKLKNYIVRADEWKFETCDRVEPNGHEYIKVLCGDISFEIDIDMVRERFECAYTEEEALLELAESFNEIIRYEDTKEFDWVLDWELAKEDLFASVINTANNEELLEELVSTEFDDLSIMYHVLVCDDEGRLDAVSVKKSFLEKWGVSVKEVHEIAMKNTRAILPPVVYPISDAIENVADARDNGMHVISNEKGIRGAIYMLDMQLLSTVCKGLEARKMYIFPSTINEIVVCDADLMEVEEANKLVASTNAKLDESVILAGHAYLFDLEAETLTSL